jgi:monoterpene epsilon-lactone hydrolase
MGEVKMYRKSGMVLAMIGGALGLASAVSAQTGTAPKTPAAPPGAATPASAPAEPRLPPYSELLRPETKEGLAQHRKFMISTFMGAKCLNYVQLLNDPNVTGAQIRACEAEIFPPVVAEMRKSFPADIVPQMIAGVQTDVVTPVGGVKGGKARKLLINLHGGGWAIGSRFNGQLESVPVASVGGYKVISVDYAMAPEHQFPAATADVIAVYKDALKTYAPSDIGIFGCSAGGQLVGQVVAALAAEHLPGPGAVGMFCAVALHGKGDSATTGTASPVGPSPVLKKYLLTASPEDPLAYPGNFDKTLRQFPPSLLITSSRDGGMSNVVTMHQRLVQAGVPAELHVFEGLDHAFFYNPYIPETRETAQIVANFFDHNLGRRRR